MILNTCLLHGTLISLTLEAYYKNNDYSPLADNSYFVEKSKIMECGKAKCLFSGQSIQL